MTFVSLCVEKETEMKGRLRTSQKNEKIHNHIKKFQVFNINGTNVILMVLR